MLDLSRVTITDYLDHATDPNGRRTEGYIVLLNIDGHPHAHVCDYHPELPRDTRLHVLAPEGLRPDLMRDSFSGLGAEVEPAAALGLTDADQDTADLIADEFNDAMEQIHAEVQGRILNMLEELVPHIIADANDALAVTAGATR